jgi:hypothetical protein
MISAVEPLRPLVELAALFAALQQCAIGGLL